MRSHHFYKSFFLISEESGRSSFLVFAFGTGMWSYSRVYLPEGLATLLGMISVFCVLLNFRSEPSARKFKPIFLAFASGIALGLMYTVDNMGLFFALPLLLVFLVRRKLESAVAILWGLFFGMTPFAYYDLMTTGNVFTPPYGLAIFGGVPPSAYSISNFLPGLYSLILSPQSGLLLYSPVVLVCAFLLRRMSKYHATETRLFAAIFLFTLIPFALQDPTTYLHNTLGPSELILGLPYLLLLGVAIERYTRSGIVIIIAAILGILGVTVNGIVALTTPVINPLISNASSGGSLSTFLQTNLQLFQVGQFSAWWEPFQQAEIFAYLVLGFPVFILIVYSTDLFVHRREYYNPPPNSGTEESRGPLVETRPGS